MNMKISKQTIVAEKAGFHQRLEQALEKSNFPPKNRGRIQSLANLMDLSHRGAGKWLNGNTVPPVKKIIILAKKLNVNPEWLITGTGSPEAVTKNDNPIEQKEAPFYTWKEWKNSYYTPTKTVPCYVVATGKLFAVQLNSKAMFPRFAPKSVVIIEVNRVAKDGDFVMVQTTLFPIPQLRQLRIIHSVYFLEAFNPHFERLILGEQDKIIGVVIQGIHFFND